jgi:hypothetical protein
VRVLQWAWEQPQPGRLPRARALPVRGEPGRRAFRRRPKTELWELPARRLGHWERLPRLRARKLSQPASLPRVLLSDARGARREASRRPWPPEERRQRRDALEPRQLALSRQRGRREAWLQSHVARAAQPRWVAQAAEWERSCEARHVLQERAVPQSQEQGGWREASRRRPQRAAPGYAAWWLPPPLPASGPKWPSSRLRAWRRATDQFLERWPARRATRRNQPGATHG